MKLKSWLERMDSRLDRVDDSTRQIQLVQERQAASLEEHIRRTIAAEESLDLLRAEIGPLKAHVAAFGVVGKLITAGGAATGLVYAVMRILGKA